MKRKLLTCLIPVFVVAALLHRYTFANSTYDSVGGAAYRGTFIGGASVSAGALQLTSTYQGLSLPIGDFDYYNSISVEMWVTTQGGSWPWYSYYVGYPYNNRWCKLFQFGQGTGSSTESTIAVYRERSNGYLYMFIGDQAYCPYVGFDSQTNLHIVLTVAAGDFAKLYVNGALAVTASYPLPVIPSPGYFRIGYGYYNVDNEYFIGSVSEFRIWGGVLSASEVIANYFAGNGKIMNSDGHFLMPNLPLIFFYFIILSSQKTCVRAVSQAESDAVPPLLQVN